MAPTRPPPDDLLYPSEDYPGAVNDWHFKQVQLLVDMLQRHLAGCADSFVGGNIFLLHYDDSGRYERLVPDVLVAFGVAQATDRQRNYGYLVWEEGVPPAVVMEIAPGDTRCWDIRGKVEPYAFVGVAEYYLFDPEAEAPTLRLQGCQRTDDGRYVSLEGPVLVSPALGLELLVVGDWLRLRDPAIGQLLPTNVEQAQALAAAKVEIARLRAELARRQEHS